MLAWHPEWQKHAAQIEEQILAQQKEQQDRQEQKQDKILDSMEKAVERPATVISHVENYQPQIQSQTNNLSPIMPGQQNLLEDE